MLQDFVREDMNRLYPALAPLVKITILEAGKTLLRQLIRFRVLVLQFTALLLLVQFV